MQNFLDWQEDQVFQWLTEELKIKEKDIDKEKWFDEYSVKGEDLLDLDMEHLEHTFGVKSRIHRTMIMKGIKKLQESGQNPSPLATQGRQEEDQKEDIDNGQNPLPLVTQEPPEEVQMEESKSENPHLVSLKKNDEISPVRVQPETAIESSFQIDSSQILKDTESHEKSSCFQEWPHIEERAPQKVEYTYISEGKKSQSPPGSKKTLSSSSDKTSSTLFVNYENTLSEDMIDQIIDLKPSSKREEYINQIEEQLRREGREGEIVKSKMVELRKSVESGTKFKNSLLSLKRLIQPINIKSLKKILDEADDHYSKIEERNIYMPLGCTGSGKTTTLLYLCGVQFKKETIQLEGKGTLDNYKEEKFPDVFDENLKKLKTSPFMESCTSHITAIETSFIRARKEEHILFVDTPGMEENRSLEQGIAGQKSIDTAAKRCKSAVIIVVLNVKSFGDRMTSVKTIAKQIAAMFRNFKKISDSSFKFFFTNCKDDDESKLKVKGLIDDFCDCENQNEDEKSDENLQKLLKQLSDAVEDTDDMIVIDPLDPKKRDKILKILFNQNQTKGIEDPAETFKMQISDSTKDAISKQVQIHLDNHIRFMGLKNQNHLVLNQKLQDIKYLSEIIDLSFLNEKYSEAVNLIKEEIDKKFEACTNSLQNFEGIIPLQYLDNLKRDQQIVGSLQKILEETCNQTQLKISADDFDLLVLSTVDKLHEQLISQDIINSQDSIINLIQVKQIFGDSLQRVEETFEKATNWCENQFIEAYEKTKEYLSQNDFQRTADNLDLMKQILKQLEPIWGESTEQEEVIEKIKRDIESTITMHKEDTQKELKNLQVDQDIKQVSESVRSIQKSHNIISKAKDCQKLNEILKDNKFAQERNEIEAQVKSIFDLNIEKIRKVLKFENQEDVMQMAHLQNIRENLSLIDIMQQEFTTCLARSCRKSFSSVINEIYTKINLCERQIENIINQGGNMKRTFEAKTLVESWTLLEGLLWMDQFSEQQGYKISMIYESLKERMKSLQKYLIEMSDEAFIHHQYEEIDPVMDRLQQLGPQFQAEYIQQQKHLQEKLQAKLIEIDDYMQKQSNDISYTQTELHLLLIQSSVQNSRHFGLNLNNEVKKVERLYFEFIEKYKNMVFFSKWEIKEKQDFTKVQRINDEINFIINRKSESLNLIFGPEKLKQDFQQNCRQQVQKFDLQRQEFKLQSKQQGLEKLRDLIEKIQDLDHYFEHSMKLKNILMEIGTNSYDNLVNELNDFIQSIKNHDYESAYFTLDTNLRDNLQEKALQIAKKYIKIHIESLDIKKNGFSSQYASNPNQRIQEFFTSLTKLQEANQFFKSGEGPTDIGAPMKEQMESTIQTCKNKLNEYFNDLIKKVYQSIRANSFENSIKLIQDMKQCQIIIESLLDKQSLELSHTIDSELDKHVEETVKTYCNMSIDLYQMKRPQILIQRMQKVSDLYNMDQQISLIEYSIKEKYFNKLKEMRDQEMELENGLQNRDFQTLKRALHSLPKNLKDELQKEIDSFEADYQYLKELEYQNNSQNIKNCSIDEMEKSFQQLVKCKRLNEYQNMVTQVVEIVMQKYEAFTTSIESFDAFDQIAQNYHQILKFKKLKERLPNIESILSQSHHLMQSRITESLNYVEPRIITHLATQQESKNLDKIEKELFFILSMISYDFFNFDSTIIFSKLQDIINHQKEQNENFESLLGDLNQTGKVQVFYSLQMDLEKIYKLIEKIYNALGQQVQISFLDQATKILKKFIQQKVAEFRQKIDQTQSKFEETRMKFFQNKLQTFKILQKMKPIGLDKFLSPEDFSGKSGVCEALFNDFIQQGYKLGENCQKQFKNDTDLGMYPKLEMALCQLKSIIEVFKDFDMVALEKMQSTLKDLVLQKINTLIQNYQKCENVESLANCLVELKRIQEVLISMKKRIGKEIDSLINNETKKQNLALPLLILQLQSMGDSEAQILLSDHQQFQAAEVLRKNALIHNANYGIDFVLDQIKSQEIQLDQNFAEKAWDKITFKNSVDKKFLQEAYKKFLKEYGVLDQDTKKYTGFLGRNLVPGVNYQRIREEVYSPLPKDIGQNLAWTKKLKQEIIPVLVAKIFGTWTVQNSQHFFENSVNDQKQNYLLTPHPAQVISIFRMLGLGNYRDTETLEKHLVQIKTGEGKSIIIAVVATVLALLGLEVYCSCYSQNLSLRDFANFRDLFDNLGVSNLIQYGTLEELCEKFINQSGDIRSSVQELMETNKVPSLRNRKTSKVLIIDEVDTFFNKQFYGAIYQPVSLIKKAEIENLLMFIWKQKPLTLSRVQKSHEYQLCCKIFSNQWNKMIDEAVKQMLFDVEQIEQHNNYFIKDNKIGYMYGDRIVYNMNYGYSTAFAYIKEQELNKISKHSMSNNIGLKVSCGNFSYAEIPLRFDSILGISGTVETMSEYQRQTIYYKYNFVMETYIPTIFGKNQLNWSTTENLFVENRLDYHQKIRKMIDASLIGIHGGKRAVLVFFKDKEELSKFYNSTIVEDIQNHINFITEEANSDEISAAVKKATKAGSITFFTRSFGRGTDFIIMDEIVKSNGGVCTIQTFPSESPSEEEQIKGRSARQGQDGSYIQIILEDDLQKYGIQSDEVKQKQNEKKLYEHIQGKVNELFNHSFQDSTMSIEQLGRDHQKAEKFLESLSISAMDAKEFLLNQNKGPSEKISKTLILIDGTISMQSILSKTMQNIQIMFERIASVLEKNNIESNQVMMKIAFYRNYNVDKDLIYQASNWETNYSNLKSFMNGIEVAGGWSNEAIEVGFYQAEKEVKKGLSQIILIGDEPPNSDQAFIYKREHIGETYWAHHLPGLKPYKHHLDNLKCKGIQIHTMFLEHNAEQAFRDISKQTGGQSHHLQINSKLAAQKLTGVVSTLVLKNIGGENNGDKYVNQYQKQFGGFT